MEKKTTTPRPQAAERSPDVPASVHAHTLSGLHILVVDDIEVNQLLARGMLLRLGCTRVTIAANGLEALAACGAQRFDLILMDCQMPEMDGLEATRVLRARGVDTPIIALTASGIAGVRQGCASAGMNDFLAKPVELQSFAETLHRWLAPPPPSRGDEP
ncbi:response regulator [Ramlibacter sp. AN1133]|uniref:response regulator n=1 Tax=Ramlibacter sp. AN1133 TaxID=3133429 RepID=UPI0030BA54E1